MDDVILNSNGFTKEAYPVDLLQKWYPTVVQIHFQPSYMRQVLFYTFFIFVAISRHIALCLTH